MTLEQDHGISAAFTWKEEYYRHLRYIAANDPDDDYYHPSSSHTADAVTSGAPDATTFAPAETGEALVGSSRQAESSEANGIDWLELKDAIKYQLQQILFDIGENGSSRSGTGTEGAAEQPQPNAYGWKGEQQGGLAVERGTKARGKGFPVKAIPTLHPAASQLAMNRIFFPPYPLQLVQGADLQNVAGVGSEAKRTAEMDETSTTEAAAAAVAAPDASSENAFITSLHSDGASEPAAQRGVGAVKDVSSEAGSSSASAPNGSDPGMLVFTTSSSSDGEEYRNGDRPSDAREEAVAPSADSMDTGAEGGLPHGATAISNEANSTTAETSEWQLVRPGDLQSFFPAKVVPPPEGFGSWGKRYTDEKEIQRDYRVLCAMLDEFDDAGYTRIAVHPEQQTEEGVGPDGTAAVANGIGHGAQGETKLVPCASPPFTIQRLCELVLEPHRHYSTLPKYMAALKRTLAVTAGKVKFPAVKDIEDDDEEEEQLGEEMEGVPGSQPEDSMMVDIGPQASATINDAMHATAATTRLAPATVDGTSVSPIFSRTSSRAGTPMSASSTSSRSRSRSRAASHEPAPLWTPIPFLMRREAEERERLASAQLVPIPLTVAGTGPESMSSASSSGQEESTTNDGSGGNDAAPTEQGSGGSQSMDLDESSGGQQQQSTSSSVPEEDGPREIPAGSALGLTEAPSAASAPLPTSTLQEISAEATSPPSGSGHGATKPTNAMQPLGVPDGLVDELDDAHWRGKSKTGLPGLDAEVHPISSTTTSSSHATASSINRAAAADAVAAANASANTDSQTAAASAEDGGAAPTEQTAQLDERQIKKLRSSE